MQVKSHHLHNKLYVRFREHELHCLKAQFCPVDWNAPSVSFHLVRLWTVTARKRVSIFAVGLQVRNDMP